MKKRLLIPIILFLIIIFIIASRGDKSPSGSEYSVGREVVGIAQVENIDILILESFPVQVNVVASGSFPDSCTEIGLINEIRQDNDFFVSVKTSRPDDVVCAQVITPFEQSIPLSVYGLKAGTYRVDVNGVKDQFILQTDNVLPEDDDRRPADSISPIPSGILD
ncbi:MAG: hypothetical protein COT91_03435 [Candidatus Doudnabacteria bacterium CG10_big_fil_rev_8_21_14_0_10_41_10]|uniref:Uncharacterized protein n=1 Tax=Candidatus Doudnabacteria bacterium CG10_big_fil_rev_8_21_14_0_10_41_10 TaxID=1974551 RepID=A0A2H0VD43_9BACT|nr:MAG: hypothetical protein COT91_03435 [Candidatus Doudnabacteria bacterium CG10_big_fil_rev_8_21_14_0_10_41_10]